MATLGQASLPLKVLQDNMRLLRAVTENASGALFIMDEHQRCVFMNPAAGRMTVQTLEEVRDRPLHDSIHHTHPDGCRYPLEECLIALPPFTA